MLYCFSAYKSNLRRCQQDFDINDQTVSKASSYGHGLVGSMYRC